jgi:uncharacterized protein
MEETNMERHVMWAPLEKPGLEHLHLIQNDELIIADSVILGLNGQVPFRIQYQISCDSLWSLRNVQLKLLSRSPRDLNLSTDGKGTWTNGMGEVIPSLNRCLDIDISATPFTNTLPIRRLALKPGMSTTLKIVYIAVPQLQVTGVEQRYTCLEATPDGGLYRYESLNNGVTEFTAELPVDSDGLVIDYPGLFRRVGIR